MSERREPDVLLLEIGGDEFTEAEALEMGVETNTEVLSRVAAGTSANDEGEGGA